MTLVRTTLAAALAVALTAAMAVALVPSASADGNNDRRISATSGAGLKAANVAKKRVGGGAVRSVRLDTDSADRYEVVVRRGTFVYDVDLSRTFKVRDIDRDRVGGHDGGHDGDDDGNDD